MSAETKVIFDQLTEDAMKLMENGDYSWVFLLIFIFWKMNIILNLSKEFGFLMYFCFADVYDEKQEVFEREAGLYYF